MSVRAYHLRRVAYRKTARQVSNPGQPSPVNRRARREAINRERFPTLSGEPYCEEPLDPDPPLKCWCGNCIQGQDRECPLKGQRD